jgi:hypothetical protein
MGTAKGALACANCLAWLLATCPDAAIRDGKRALSIAKQVVEQDPSSGNLDTLAAAYSETESFNDAVRVQQQAVRNSQLKDRKAKTNSARRKRNSANISKPTKRTDRGANLNEPGRARGATPW